MTPRDLALIVLAGVVSVAVLVCLTVLCLHGVVPATAAVAALAGPAGVAGMALGRLSGANASPTP